MEQEPLISVRLLVSGAHLATEYGFTVEQIEAEGYDASERIATFDGDDSAAGIGRSMARGLAGFADLFARRRPDLLIVFGDRHDMLPAALAAVPFGLPIAHISGGEVTEGAIDDVLRHAMTKLSHLHFVSTEIYGQRILQMGEEEWRVVVSGSLSIDALLRADLMSVEETSAEFSFDASRPFALVTTHPVTLESDQTETHIRNLLSVTRKLGGSMGMEVVFTAPNPDTTSALILTAIRGFCSEHAHGHFVVSAGSRGYFSLMNLADVMIGNSSSGITEAPSFGLPVVNIGTRQRGRIRARNVIDSGYEVDQIMEAVERARSDAFRAGLVGMVSPFGDGHAADRIVERLLAIESREDLLRKQFVSWESDSRADEEPS
jgi:UDP-hydrolysing UDP-N-acetyl-D-glucosamine 2-epimerase